MRTLTVLAVTTLLIATLLVPTAGAADPVHLAGSTTITGRTMSATQVVLPAAAELDLTYTDQGTQRSVTIDSGPGLAGVLLRQVGGDGTYVAVTKLPDDPARRQHTVGIGVNAGDQFRPRLPAGTYDLYLIAQSPTTVTIDLAGLTGTTTLDLDGDTTGPATRPVTGEVMVPNVEQDYRSPDAPGQLGAGGYGLGWLGESTGDRTFVFDAFWYHGPTEPVPGGVTDQPAANIGQAERCKYGNPIPGDAGPFSFAPGCPGGTTASSTTVARALQTASVVLFGMDNNAPAHPLGRGGYAIHTGIHDPGMSGYWIQLP
jgi:hypothetical protein